MCQRLASLLGVRISVASRPGHGSTFTLALELDPADQVEFLEADPKIAPAAPLDLASQDASYQGRVLVAEDAPDIQALLTLALARAGLNVDVAENGAAACRRALASAAEGRPYDLILMDVQMPELDGWAATGRLRKAGWTKPIVALTAHAMTGTPERCLAAGCDHCLAKPVTQRNLLETLGRYLPARASALQPPVAPAPSSDRPLLDASQIAPDQRARVQALCTTTLQNLLPELRQAQQDGDRERLAACVRTLSAAGKVFGITDLEKCAAEITRQLRSGARTTDLAESLQTLHDICQHPANVAASAPR